jgi:UDP-N-acetylmuramate-alanine ligase
MSALARYYKHAGALVAGYDRTPSALTAELEREGIAIHYEDNVTLIPKMYRESPRDVLVIYTPAVPAEHSELQFFQNNSYTIIKRSKALGHIAAGKTTIAVAGTHGKSTTSTLLAHLLAQAGDGCTAFLGGISKNYNSNLILSQSPVLVAEADEFDRSFLQLFPQIAIITATDADHLDIYGTAAEVKQAFAAFANQIKPGGTLILKLGIDLTTENGERKTENGVTENGERRTETGNRKTENALVAPFPVNRSPLTENARVAPRTLHPEPCTLPAPCTVFRYSLDQPCDFYASNIRLLSNGLSQFDIHLPDGILTDCTLGIPGQINIENAVAAVAAVWAYEKWLTENGKRGTENGKRKTENGERGTENGERRTVNGERRTENGKPR